MNLFNSYIGTLNELATLDNFLYFLAISTLIIISVSLSIIPDIKKSKNDSVKKVTTLAPYDDPNSPFNIDGSHKIWGKSWADEHSKSPTSFHIEGNAFNKIFKEALAA